MKKKEKADLTLYRCIIRWVENHGFQPTIREMAKDLDMDRNAVLAELQSLEDLGLITWPRTKERRIILHFVRFKAVHDPTHNPF